MTLLLCVKKKSSSFVCRKEVYYGKLEKKKGREGCVKKRLSFVWFFNICGLQFGIVREVFCRLVLVSRFGELLSLGVFQLLDLLCGSLFGLCAIRIWFFGFVFVRENYLGGFMRVPLHQFVLSQTCYSEI